MAYTGERKGIDEICIQSRRYWLRSLCNWRNIGGSLVSLLSLSFVSLFSLSLSLFLFRVLFSFVLKSSTPICELSPVDSGASCVYCSENTGSFEPMVEIKEYIVELQADDALNHDGDSSESIKRSTDPIIRF